MASRAYKYREVIVEIHVYSDGSGNTFSSDGGWGFRILVDGAFLLEGSGYLSSATNNVAELTAAIEGLKAAEKHLHTHGIAPGSGAQVTLISDSQLVLGYANGAYKCKATHLTPLYVQIRKLYNSLQAKTKWVRGHSGNVDNERCDELAKMARESKGIDAEPISKVADEENS